jgi:thioredoxin reductase (NADPH)
VARTVLCATGVEWRRLQAPGVDRLLQAGVYYGSAISESPGLVGKDVLVIGGGNSAGQAAMNFAGTASSVTLVVRSGHLAASMSAYLTRRLAAADNVHLTTHAEVVAAHGEDWLRAVDLRDTRDGLVRRVEAAAMFVCIGGHPRTEWASAAGLAVDDAGYLLAGRDILDRDLSRGTAHWTLPRDPYPLETSQPGLFVAGDVRHGSTKRVSAAVGEGAMAVGLVHRYLQELVQV